MEKKINTEKVIRLTEQDLERMVRRIIKESDEFDDEDLLTYVLNVMVKNGLVDKKNVNVYDNNFEVYGFNKGPREYFLDNHIVFEVGGVDELFFNFVMGEEDIDAQDALEVVNWLYPTLDELFGGKIAFMDNLDEGIISY
jgi:hypothetical protein